MRVILSALLLLYTSGALAKDLGVHGELFEISEPDMLLYIEEKLRTLEGDGTLAKKQEEMQEHAKKRINRPKAVAGITHVQKYTKRYYDPTYVLKEDIKDADGDVIHKKGKRVNPLEIMPLSHRLIFIDGDDKEQVSFAFKESKAYLSKIILVKGNVGDLMREHKIRLYFDQMGILTSKFGIDKVPTVLSQSGTKVLLEEINPQEGRG